MTLSHATIQELGHYQIPAGHGVPDETLRALYHQMLRIRQVEEAIVRAYPSGEIRCPVHFCIGQEAVPAALAQVIQPDDVLFSHHRSHGYYLAKGCPLDRLIAELYGKTTGINGGLAGSQDISDPSKNFYAGAILSGAVSIACGVARGLVGSGRVVVAACGEGATDEGAFWEAMNYAALERLPILFLIENNRYATFSDQLKRQRKDDICGRACAFGVPAASFFGNDALKVYGALKWGIENIREAHGPFLLEFYTFRQSAHVGPESDDAQGYRTRDEIEWWADNDPLRILGDALPPLFTEDEMERGYGIADEIAAAFHLATTSPFRTSLDAYRANWNDETPEADRLLVDWEPEPFNPNQSEATLAPY